MQNMESYMKALDIVAKMNHIDDYVEELQAKEDGRPFVKEVVEENEDEPILPQEDDDDL